MSDGIGAMLHYLGGGSNEDLDRFYGRKIHNAVFDDDENFFEIEFEDGGKIRITDQGQSCCESRYMTCDDRPEDLVGGELTRIEVTKHEDKEEGYGCHETCFLIIESTKMSITVCTHNRHNGYYGGFGLNISEVAKS